VNTSLFMVLSYTTIILWDMLPPATWSSRKEIKYTPPTILVILFLRVFESPTTRRKKLGRENKM
jgi:hypothetical protein